ncbi:cytochrome c [Lysobacter sp. KIS68-7]|uniref:c-type cytochrome n=1 Tax=Lysobacter sp. KIS68-7 TaxID=2904252 RepID=UPI001E5A7500|nr:cytochrome c [Lysobacter sp. KIS68-7]UHQ20286.1 cytochrome c [Lysobacter sp. KIS68-7]
MRRALRILGKTLLVLGVLAGLALGVVYFKTQSMLKVAPYSPQVGLRQGDVAEGARLARVMGCRGCHTNDLTGDEFISEPNVFVLVAPNLTREREKYDDRAWLRLFRTGAKADGQLAVGMPIDGFQRLTDQEVGHLVAYVRSVPRRENPTLGRTHLYPLARIGLLTGKFNLEDIAGDIPDSPKVLAQRDSADRGEHIAHTACVECHGPDLQGGGELHTPPLIVAKGYSPDKFARLMRTGLTAAGTESASGLMSDMGRRRFSALTDEEVADLHRYLLSR